MQFCQLFSDACFFCRQGPTSAQTSSSLAPWRDPAGRVPAVVDGGVVCPEGVGFTQLRDGKVRQTGARRTSDGPPVLTAIGEQANEFPFLRGDTDDRLHRLCCSQAAIRRRVCAVATCSAASRGESSRLYWVSVNCCGQVMASSAKCRAATM